MDFNSWICKIMLRSSLWLDLLTWNAIVAFSEQCEAKLVHVLCTRTLAIGSCTSDKRAVAVQQQPLYSRARRFMNVEFF